MVSAEVSGLFIYPLKSAAGIPADQAVLTEFGLRHDRRWMAVTGDGRFVTQRNQPQLALIQTHLETDSLLLTKEGHGSVRIPFESEGGAQVRTRVWKDTVQAVDRAHKRADQDDGDQSGGYVEYEVATGQAPPRDI